MTNQAKLAEPQVSERTDESSDRSSMSLFEHLAELRKRLLICVLAIICGAFCAYCYSSEIFSFLSAPFFATFKNGLLIGTTPSEAFMVRLKVSIWSGVFLVFPILAWQGYRFAAPGLHDQERRIIIPFVFFSSVLFIGGAAFSYYAMLPIMLQFFADQYSIIEVTPTITISEHLSFVVLSVIAFGTVFQMPIVSVMLTRSGLITYKDLLSWFRVAIVAILVVAGVFTPPDVLSQILMAIPLTMLYIVSIGLSYLVEPIDSVEQ